MSAATKSISSMQAGSSSGVPLAQIMSPADAAIYTTARPIIPKLRSKGTCAPFADCLHAPADISLFLRNFSDGIGMLSSHNLSIGGSPLVGLTSVLYAGIGPLWVYDSYKNMKACERNGDAEGSATARAQILENISLSIASAALTIQRGFGIVQELFFHFKDVMVLPTAATAVLAVASWFSAAFFTIYYAMYSWRLCQVLRGLSKGDALREKILGSKNPLSAFNREVNERMYNEKAGKTEKDYTKIALEEGALWLEKLEKEAKIRGKNVPWEPTLESRKEHAEKLFLKYPQWMMGEMGKTINWDHYDARGKITRFGEFVATKRLREKIENDLRRALGPDALEATKKNDPVVLKTALESADWSHWGIRWKTVIKIALAMIGTAAIVTGTVMMGGIPLGVLLLLFGIGGIVWILVNDGAVFKSQWESGDVRKRDKFLIYFSFALSVLAIGGLIALSVMTGGLPIYIASIVLATAWLTVNTRAMVNLIDSQRRPWLYQKVVTAKAFEQFIKTNPSREKIQEILNKMSQYNREGLQDNFETSWEAAAQVWREHLKELEERSFNLLMEEMREVSRPKIYQLGLI